MSDREVTKQNAEVREATFCGHDHGVCGMPESHVSHRADSGAPFAHAFVPGVKAYPSDADECGHIYGDRFCPFAADKHPQLTHNFTARKGNGSVVPSSELSGSLTVAAETALQFIDAGYDIPDSVVLSLARKGKEAAKALDDKNGYHGEDCFCSKCVDTMLPPGQEVNSQNMDSKVPIRQLSGQKNDLARRRAKLADEMVELQNDIEHWNRTHPNEEPIILNPDLTDDVRAWRG